MCNRRYMLLACAGIVIQTIIIFVITMALFV